MQVEEHLKTCRLCAEALEGYKSRGSKSYLHSDVEYLSRKVRREYNSRSFSPGRRMPVFIAFTLAVFLLIVAIILFVLQQNISSQKALPKVKADSSVKNQETPADTSGSYHVGKSE